MLSSSFSSKQSVPRVVESHSVQSQFSALTRDRDRLRWEVESADRQRHQQEGLVKELRTLQSSISQQLQTAHASLGSFQKQKTLLEKEKARLSFLLDKERKELEESHNKIQLLIETEKHSKEQYLQEMHEWNEELEQLLVQAEEVGWKRVISHDTMDMIPGVDMADSKTLWQEAVDKKLTEEQAYKAMTAECDAWRAHAQKHQPDLDWKQLEQAWEQETSNDVTVNLFYGANPESPTGEQDQ